MFPLSVARIPPFKYFPTAEYKDALQKLELHGRRAFGQKERPQPQEKPLAVENPGET